MNKNAMVKFSKSIKNMRSSEIRRLMKLADDPSVISFAGGMPENDLLPTDIVCDLYESLSLTQKQAAFQYGPTAGYPPLLEVLKTYLKTKGLPVEMNDLIITTGAQQAINLVSKVLINPGDMIFTEYPSFIGALAAFRSYGANLVGIDVDSEGIKIEKLNKVINEKKRVAKMIYLIPNFQNPSGLIYSERRKKALLNLLSGRNLCILEDDPYCEIYFDETDKELTAPLKAIGDESIPICYIGSFSKIFGPGMRLGWLLGPPEIIEKCGLAKQSMDACSSTFTQVFAHAFLTQNMLLPYLKILRKAFKKKAHVIKA